MWILTTPNALVVISAPMFAQVGILKWVLANKPEPQTKIWGSLKGLP